MRQREQAPMVAALTLTWVGRLPDYTGTEFAPQYIGLFAMGMLAASLYTSRTPRWARLRAPGENGRARVDRNAVKCHSTPVSYLYPSNLADGFELNAAC